MDAEEVWLHIHNERARLAGLLGGLEQETWDRPTLCGGWAVRHVAAHVISSAEAGPRDVAAAMWRGRGNFNRALYLQGLRLGAQSPEDILAAFERNRASRRHPVGTSLWEPLVDVLVHTQDIALPLGVALAMPVPAARAAAARVWSNPFPFRARHRLRNFRLTADDADFFVGAGRDVHGPMAALLLLLTGRSAALPLLKGNGVHLLPSR